MKKEEVTKEHHSCASAEPTRKTATVPAHHRFCCTRLWQAVHGETEDGRPYEYGRGAEESTQTEPSAADGTARTNASVVLDEFRIELHDYCREEKDLAERLRTLRATRSGLVSTLFLRTHPEAGKKCGRPGAGRTGARRLRRRVRDYPHGAGRAIRYGQ